ncbi:MAG: hypothetical protein QOH05_1713 [Acetobacteraceae bacterium]|jgi:hypothetical protein|nr:hypothetical protein [Acetobacteraceae bacterium]
MQDSPSQPCRALWIQVITQAKDDLDGEPCNSILYDQAAAFFVGGGQWAESRADIADLLGMHPDDLVRSGRRWIAERRQRDGLPPELTPRRAAAPPTPSAAAPSAPAPSPPRPLVVLPWPRLEALPPPAKIRMARGARRDGAPIGVAQEPQPVGLADHPAPIRQKAAAAVRRRWYDVPGAINPFAPRLPRPPAPAPNG